LVKNQKPKARSLEETQAINWHERATKALRDYIAGRYHCTPKELQQQPPRGDEDYNNLVADLEWAKAYRAYLKGNTDNQSGIMPVDEWRKHYARPSVRDGRLERPEPEAQSAQQAEPVTYAAAVEQQRLASANQPKADPKGILFGGKDIVFRR
jgi:hypothetical protein